MDVIEPDKSFGRQKTEGSADKVFPDQALLYVGLTFSPQDMEKVKTWYANTRRELGDKFVADFEIARLLYEALAGGAVNPSIVVTRIVEEIPHD